jgi:hypothetical protein
MAAETAVSISSESDFDTLSATEETELSLGSIESHLS